MKRVLPFLILGPITGPLVAGIVYNIRERPILGGLYAVALASVSVALPTTLVELLHMLQSVASVA
jgi:hypothetical protein